MYFKFVENVFIFLSLPYNEKLKKMLNRHRSIFL